MTKELTRLVSSAKYAILRHLAIHGVQVAKELESAVLSIINIKEKRNGEIERLTKPIRVLAYIMAYKELETDGEIKIFRPVDLPFPMTDYRTTFELSNP